MDIGYFNIIFNIFNIMNSTKIQVSQDIALCVYFVKNNKSSRDWETAQMIDCLC